MSNNVVADKKRALATAKAAADSALRPAENIADPFDRCRALATIARNADGKYFNYIIAKAVKAARDIDDAYQRVAGVSWPVRAMIERGWDTLAFDTVTEFLPFAARIENPVRRGDALFTLWQAAYPWEASAKIVLPVLLSACGEMNSWKAPRLLGMVVGILAKDDGDAARGVLALMNEGRRKRQAEREMAAGKFDTPRNFFW